MPAKRVLSIGQCGADHYRIQSTLAHHFDAHVTPVASEADAVEQLRQGPFALVLVNRILDFTCESGLEIIPRLLALEGAKAPPIMLVSNYEEYQRQAEAVGAARGFGKAELDDAETLERLRKYLG